VGVVTSGILACRVLYLQVKPFKWNTKGKGRTEKMHLLFANGPLLYKRRATEKAQ
jgi:hypothetical protein